MTNTHRCDACLDGEHADYDADVRRVSIYESGMFLRRESLCAHHREALAEDGYDIREPRPAPLCATCDWPEEKHEGLHADLVVDRTGAVVGPCLTYRR